MITKSFKIAATGNNLNSDRPQGLLLVAKDGECWKVRQVHTAETNPLKVGDIIEVPVRSDGQGDMVDWRRLGCDEANRMQLRHPFQIVAKVWGDETTASNDVPICHPGEETLVEPCVIFESDHFEDTNDVTAELKADVANAFVTFTQNGFRLEYLTDSLYQLMVEGYRLGVCDPTHKELFFHNHFGNASKRQQFVRTLMTTEPMGDPAFGMTDVLRAIRAFSMQYVTQKVTQTTMRADSMRERALLIKLLIRHGLPQGFKLPGQ